MYRVLRDNPIESLICPPIESLIFPPSLARRPLEGPHCLYTAASVHTANPACTGNAPTGPNSGKSRGGGGSERTKPNTLRSYIRSGFFHAKDATPAPEGTAAAAINL